MVISATCHCTAEHTLLRPTDKEHTMEIITSIRYGWAKKAAAIATLGLAGALSLTACSINPTPKPAPTSSASPVATRAPAAPTSTSSTQPSQPQPAQQAPAQPAQPDPDTSSGRSAESVAQQVADYLVSDPFVAGDGTVTTAATCDSATVSDPADVSTPTSVSCDITYSDGSEWQQTVTITYDDQGNPTQVSTNDGIELSPATSE
jgi:hypothetical protein